MANKTQTPKQTVLITGCSDGGMGAALAIALHQAGLHVYATARNPAKMQNLSSIGIQTLVLDVQSPSSITECVAKIPALDILINNAGGQYVMPVVDVDIDEAKKLYDLNVWSHLAVTQAFLPLLLKSSNGMIVNHTSVAAVTTIPFQAIYNSSKAAFSMISDSMRLELQAFNIKVVELKTGVVRTNLIKNLQESSKASLPKGSIYEPAREVVDKAIKQEGFEGQGLLAQDWADAVARDLLKANPPSVIWRGESACLARVSTVMPYGMFDGMVKKMSGLGAAEEMVRK
ncbi:hypothetical protein F66182_960 [Fusarium sp. NRRL 66182]|nr:hypothetical protein F66182_960 [Fusarium sp. NRRL 66182]